MLSKLKRFVKGNKTYQNPEFEPYFRGSGKKVDMSLNFEINETEVEKELQQAFAKGEERKLLMENADYPYFPAGMDSTYHAFRYYQRQKQSILHKKMAELCNEQEILKLMDNPQEFFQRGWCYPNPYPTDLIQMQYSNKVISGKAFDWNFCFDEKFYLKPENLEKLYKCAQQYFSNCAEIVLNNPKTRITYINKDLINLFQCSLGFKLQFDSCLNKSRNKTEKLLNAINEKVEEDPSPENCEKAKLLSQNMLHFIQLKHFRFPKQKELTSEYQRLMPGYYSEDERTYGGFEIM